MQPGDYRNDVKTVHRLGCLLFAVTALVAWGLGVWAMDKVPWVDDLGNLISHGANPSKPESTGVYLFLLPAGLTIVALVYLVAPAYVKGHLAKAWFPPYGVLLFQVVGALSLLGLAFRRVAVAVAFPY